VEEKRLKKAQDEIKLKTTEVAKKRVVKKEEKAEPITKSHPPIVKESSAKVELIYEQQALKRQAASTRKESLDVKPIVLTEQKKKKEKEVGKTNEGKKPTIKPVTSGKRPAVIRNYEQKRTIKPLETDVSPHLKNVFLTEEQKMEELRKKKEEEEKKKKEEKDKADQLMIDEIIRTQDQKRELFDKKNARHPIGFSR